MNPQNPDDTTSQRRHILPDTSSQKPTQISLWKHGIMKVKLTRVLLPSLELSLIRVLKVFLKEQLFVYEEGFSEQSWWCVRSIWTDFLPAILSPNLVFNATFAFSKSIDCWKALWRALLVVSFSPLTLPLWTLLSQQSCLGVSLSAK